MYMNKVSQLKNTKAVTWGDIIVVVAVVIISLIALVPLLLNRGEPTTVLVSVGGKESEYSLSQNREIDLGTMVVVIENGSVFVKSTTCSEKICYYTGKISQVNQRIVCQPHGIVITIKGASEFNADTGSGV